jgi:hypothetical protein
MEGRLGNIAITGKKRWFIYGLSGILFGVIDWYYLNLLGRFPWGNLGNSLFIVPVIIVLNYGIWLLPVLPITIHESRVSRSALRSALAGALCWSCSIISYYFFYTLLLAFWGLPNMEHLLILGSKQVGFGQEWNTAFREIILNQVFEWLPIAIIGGSLIGLIVWWLTVQKRAVKHVAINNND